MLQYLDLELTVESPMEFKGRKLRDRINCHYIGPEASNLPGNQDEIERFRTSVRIGRSKLKGILEARTISIPTITVRRRRQSDVSQTSSILIC